MHQSPDARYELVASALLRGKIQQKHYQTRRHGVEVVGTVAVVRRGEQYVVGFHELHDEEKKRAAADFDYDRYLDQGFDVDERHELPDLAAVERLLSVRLQLCLEELGPAKGYRFRM